MSYSFTLKLLKASASVSLIIYLFSIVDVSSSVKSIDFFGFSFYCSIVVSLLIIVAMAMRQHSIFTANLILKKKIVSIQFSSQFWGYLSPGGVGVDALKFLALNKYISSKSYLVSSLLIDRLSGMVWVLCVGSISFILCGDVFFSHFGFFNSKYIILIFVFSILVIFYIFSRYRDFLIRTVSLLRGRKMSLFFWSGLVFFLSVIRLMVIAQMAEINLPFIIFTMLPLIVLVSSLWPFSIAGLGVIEVSIIGFLTFINVPVEQSFILALTLRLVGAITCIIGYVISFVLLFNLSES